METNNIIEDLKQKYKINPKNSDDYDQYLKEQNDIAEKKTNEVLRTMLDEKYFNAKMSDFKVLPENQRTFNTINGWLANYVQGKWLVLKGNQGTGKTLLKNIIIRELYTKYKIRSYSTTHYTLFTLFMDGLKSGKNNELLETLGKKKMMIVDEVGRRKQTEAFNDFMFEVFDRIYLNGGSALLITNAESIKEYFDLSRLSEVGMSLPLTGNDGRS